jgi:hypothetical protein
VVVAGSVNRVRDRIAMAIVIAIVIVIATVSLQPTAPRVEGVAGSVAVIADRTATNPGVNATAADVHSVSRAAINRASRRPVPGRARSGRSPLTARRRKYSGSPRQRCSKKY